MLVAGENGFHAEHQGTVSGLRALFPSFAAVRTVVRVAVDRISDSCGYAVPRFTFAGEREQLADWAARKGPDGVAEYQATRNRASLDGLPGLRRVT